MKTSLNEFLRSNSQRKPRGWQLQELMGQKWFRKNQTQGGKSK